MNNKQYRPQKVTIRDETSLLPENNNKSEVFMQSIGPKKGHQQDRYEGSVDPVSRLRHGIGTYHYPNRLFTFHGKYENGVKNGEGTLSMSDGTVIKGIFENNQLNGAAQINYSDGSKYEGNLVNGEKDGEGTHTTMLQNYTGQFKQNKRQGKGVLKTKNCTISGCFENNKPHGEQVLVQKYNYRYEGGYECGLKSGKGKEVSLYHDDNFIYEGQFHNHSFEGQGKYKDNGHQYNYQGQFKDGLPVLYPNQFRISLASAAFGTLPEGQSYPEQYANITYSENPIQYEVESQTQLYFLIQCCYQGPEELDPNQPTQEQIDKMIKDWETQNKKNKNPPQMPDFNQPKMIKPDLVLVQQESRPIHVKIAKGDPLVQNSEEKQLEFVKVDYRKDLAAKREENQAIKIQNAKKAQEEGGKKGGKGNAKGAEPDLKLNCFVEAPSVQSQTLPKITNSGKCYLNRIQLPDDFPQGNYHIIIESPFTKFGSIKNFTKSMIVKAKNAGGKKK